ncbi:low temperature requirement protein A [Micromonospora sp. NPDC049559]|uniref:low temperature requirement protein A n=1 Tax=Micromonospora sp. NPDC049559 TaxID=3155923 RepID=UPI00341B6F4C
MTETGAGRLLRNPEAPARATLLELLYDVVYVAALALLSMRLAGQVTLPGAVHSLLLLMAIWWTWSVTTILTDFYDPGRPFIQLVVGTTMVGVVLMTAALPTAFDGHGVLFASAYVAIHFVRGILLVSALRGHEAQARAARFLFWFMVSGVAWIGGGLAGGTARAWLWALALLIDYVSSGLRYPTPFIGRVPLAQYDKGSEHLGERYQQFVILALGDMVLVPTLRLRDSGFAGARIVAFLAAFATTLLLWQIYVYRAGAFLRTAITRSPARATRWAAYTHLIMVAGIVATAAGFEVVLKTPTVTTATGWIGLIMGGPALFLVGRMTFEYEVFGRVPWSRLGWLVVLVGVGPLMVLVPSVAVTVITALILLGIAISDVVVHDLAGRWRRRQRSRQRPEAGSGRPKRVRPQGDGGRRGAAGGPTKPEGP